MREQKCVLYLAKSSKVTKGLLAVNDIKKYKIIEIKDYAKSIK